MRVAGGARCAHDVGSLQRGEQPDDFKPMPSVGKGVEELRLWDEAGAFRVVYCARLPQAVVMLHAFQKKTQATARADIELARTRWQQLLQERCMNSRTEPKLRKPAPRVAPVRRAEAAATTHASVWDALADTPEQAANLSARAALMWQIAAIVQEAGWTQAEAAERCHVTQPRINDLLRGRVSRFSLDALVNIATALERKVRLDLLAA